MEHSEFFSPAIALWNQRQALLENRDRLTSLATIIDWLNDLRLYSWGQWFTTTLEFAPDLIIELGRGFGNSTCVFTEAANHLDHCEVVSFCLSDIWATEKTPLIREVVPPQWFKPLDARIENILEVDFKALLEGKQRVLLLWDAHGFEIASVVLGHLLPLLQDRQHLVIMHDISDARYVGENHMGYQGKGLWHGESAASERMILGHLNSAVAQAISIVDFTSRNHLTLHSSDHSYHTEFSQEQLEQLRHDFGEEWFCQNGHWFWFSLNEKPADTVIHFPDYDPEALAAQLAKPTQAETDRLEWERQFQTLEAEKQHYQELAGHLQNRITAMESSKFWQLRKSWMTTKRLLGLKAE